MIATPQQEQAITIRERALLVEAGAGTGKTWVLVRRFLHLLGQHPDWSLESLIAITFTEKAAREMRSRIRSGIEARAGEAPPDSPWQAWRRALDRLQVGTIHGLCARLLRENAIAAGVDPRFSVLDENEADLLKEEAIRSTLHDLVRARSPILGLLSGLHIADLRSEMAELLARRGTVEQLFATLEEPAVLLARWHEEIARMQRTVWQGCLAADPLLPEALAVLPTLPIPDPTDKLVPSVQAAQAGCQCVAEDDLAGAAHHFEQINLRGGKQGSWGSKELLDDLKAMLRAVREAAERLREAGGTRELGADDEAAATALHQWRALWEQLSTTYDNLKVERHALDFDDLERHTARLLEQEPRDPRLHAFIEGIHHLMVDEFQDTNRTQQRIVYALAHPSAGGRLFVVGDAKQSIYRFRQAQVAVFNETEAQIAAVTGEPAVALTDSFRTHQGLLSALNHLFNHLLRPLGEAHEPFEARPSPLLAQRAAHPTSLAPVELWMLPTRSEDGNRLPSEAARQMEAALLAERLLALQAEKFPVWDKEQQHYRPFQFSDAAILFRATTALPLYEEQFKSVGLPYLTVGGRGYYDRPEVQDLIALLACLHNPGDDLSLATVLRSPLFTLSDETLYRLRWRDAADGSLISDLPRPLRYALSDPPPTSQPDTVASAAATLHYLWAWVGRVEVWELLLVALARTGYEATLALADATGGGRQRRNVQKFMELARERGGASLSDFLRWVQGLRAREAREGEALVSAPRTGAVQLMSVHAAKGLEFPVVALADLGRSPRGGQRNPLVLADPAFGLACRLRDETGSWQTPASYAWAAWMNQRMERAESKRLLYVACTRAADLLLLSGQPGRGEAWLADICEAWQVETEGDAEQIIASEGFALRVRRPRPQGEGGPARRAAPPPTHPGMASLPPLAEPLARPEPALPTPTTRDEGVESLRPAAYGLDDSLPTETLPDFFIESIVRRVLAAWRWLEQPTEALLAHLRVVAQQEGISHPDSLHLAVTRALNRLDALEQSQLCAEIAEASRCYPALPFTLASAHRTTEGTLDLLYQTEAGDWHLVAWEAGWVPASQRTARIAERRPALYDAAQAVEQTLGVRPTLTLCFLAPTVEAWWVEEP